MFLFERDSHSNSHKMNFFSSKSKKHCYRVFFVQSYIDVHYYTHWIYSFNQKWCMLPYNIYEYMVFASHSKKHPFNHQVHNLVSYIFFSVVFIFLFFYLNNEFKQRIRYSHISLAFVNPSSNGVERTKVNTIYASIRKNGNTK